MKQEDVFQQQLLKDIPEKTGVGIDIGSRQAKGVLLHHGEIYTALDATGFFMQETADLLLEELIKKANIKRSEIDYVVVTGYGRIALNFSDLKYRMVTEIACHGKGAHFLAENIHTIIDIGGQDSKVIRINPEDGSVENFAMNDKCAAGTGTFLEKIAAVLGLDVTEIGDVSLKSENPTRIDSTCVVFAESEVVSNRAKGATVENIAAGIHQSVARRVNGLLKRVGIESNVLFTGGVSKNSGMRKAIEDVLGVKIAESKLDTVFAGALGAAVFAAEFAEKNLPTVEIEDKKEPVDALDLTSFRKAVENAKYNYIHRTTGKKVNVAFSCVYTPIEIAAAANVSFIRFLHRGTQDEVIAGEVITQSMLCDYIKSIIGGFMLGSELTNAVDKVYAFYTCTCMRSAINALNQKFVPAEFYNVPRKRNEESSRAVLASEIKSFKEDLEKLTGEEIPEERIREKIDQYNKARAYMREIADYRKADASIVSSSDYKELVVGYFTLPIEQLLKELEQILLQLRQKTHVGKKKLRVLLTGGIVAEGDNKITKILEDLGVSVVAEDNCTGVKAMDYTVNNDRSQDVYLELANAYFGKAPCSRMSPKQNMLDYTRKIAEDYRVDGAIFYYLKFCPSFSFDEKLYKDLFEESKIPLLILSGDYAVGDEGQLKTRLEAFTEVLNQRV